MAHIQVPVGVPGIRSLFQFSPETAKPLCDLAETLLRKPSTLTQGERELIASYVSHLNACKYCTRSHSAFATAYLDHDASIVEKVKNNPDTAPISEKLKALLKVAAKVQKDGKTVTAADIENAKSKGAIETEIHDTVLIAAAFCMYNRYVDGLGTWAPEEKEIYEKNAERIVSHGYQAIPTKS
jgi:uncharacterized peroxidase-related enzyme